MTRTSDTVHCLDRALLLQNAMPDILISLLYFNSSQNINVHEALTINIYIGFRLLSTAYIRLFIVT